MKELDSGKGEACSIIASTMGGVMTKEVGAITGDLEIATRPTDNGTVEVTARYAGADEWYVVEGGPIEPGEVGSPAPSEPPGLHERVVEHLVRPGSIVEGNEEATSLHGFCP